VATDGLQVESISPHNGMTGVGSTAPISIEFSSAISSQSTMPTLAPTVPGSWRISGKTVTFTPDEPFVPLSQVTLTVPGGSDGVRANNGGALAATDVDNFDIEDGSTLRLQQLFSLLDYSPLSWSSTSGTISSSDTAAQLATMYSRPTGQFVWASSGWPSSLTGLWKPGSDNVFTRSLVMSFQADHGLVVSGTPSAGLWNDLLSAIATNDVNTGGYNYAVGDKTAPQTLMIYHDGTVVLHTSANTGIPQSPTPSGTFPVYARYRNYVMRGTNPDGVAYADPVQYVAYFYDGDAVHYFPRADYGIPQSLGCIELPLAEAAIAWPYLAYGTLVTVVN
jgi:peptidoglycan hydrolase-like protein with peptidoglycan-binding domain